MAEQTHDPQEEAGVKQYPLTHSASFATGTFALAGLIDALAHLGPTGLLVRGLAGLVAWRHGPELYDYVQQRLREAFPPASPTQEPEESTATERPVHGRSLLDRAIGRFPDQEVQMPPTGAHRSPSQAAASVQGWDERWYDAQDEEEQDRVPSASSARFTLSELLDAGFTPSLQQVFLARLPDGSPVYVAAKDLCHVALAGVTGGGKGVLIRLLLAQLCHLRVPVLLLNPHYMRYDQVQEEDWTPFEPLLQQSPLVCASYPQIKHSLQWMAETLLPRRIERCAQGGRVGKPYFIVLDELPAIVAEIKEAPGYLAKILREGRKYGIFLIVAGQDFLAKTVASDGEGAIRKCYRTAFYVGGDSTTARMLLNLPLAKIPENALGKGTVMLRCASTREAVLAQVPYVDNAALYRLLGPSTYTPPSAVLHTGNRERQDEEELALPRSSGAETPSPSEARRQFSPKLLEAIRQMRQAHFSDTEIRQLVTLSERDYQQALTVLFHQSSAVSPILPSPATGTAGPCERGEGAIQQGSGNERMAVNEPEKRGNAAENVSESSPAQEHGFPTFSPAEEVQVLLAYAELLKAGTSVTRTGIRDHLKWDNKQYTRVIKPVCDKHHIG
jgi:hypothetical protein